MTFDVSFGCKISDLDCVAPDDRTEGVGLYNSLGPNVLMLIEPT